jgi:hypothetical protein
MPSKKSLRGGSTASDAVMKHVPDAAFEQMNRAFTNDFTISGGARRVQRVTPKKRVAPKIDMNASPTVKMVIRNKKGGANVFHADIGKPDVQQYNVPNALPASSMSGMFSKFTNWNQGTQTIPYPQLEMASRDFGATQTIGDKPPHVGAGKPKAKAKAKSKAKAKVPAKSKL